MSTTWQQNVAVLGSGWEKPCLFRKKKTQKRKWMQFGLVQIMMGIMLFQRFQSWRHYPFGYEVSGMEVMSTN